jgi:hypothetical protein
MKRADPRQAQALTHRRSQVEILRKILCPELTRLPDALDRIASMLEMSGSAIRSFRKGIGPLAPKTLDRLQKVLQTKREEFDGQRYLLLMVDAIDLPSFSGENTGTVHRETVPALTLTQAVQQREPALVYPGYGGFCALNLPDCGRAEVLFHPDGTIDPKVHCE